MLLLALAILVAVAVPAVDSDHPLFVPMAGGRLTQIGLGATTLETDAVDVGGASTVRGAIHLVSQSNPALVGRAVAVPTSQ